MINAKKVFKTSCGCWLYLSAWNKDGYGGANYNGEWIAAHRAMWLEKKGPIPDGLCVLHKCDVPCCVNPRHLFLGTRVDNNKDRAVKGRTVTRFVKGMKMEFSQQTRERMRASRIAYLERTQP